jgi:hypothetical protein
MKKQAQQHGCLLLIDLLSLSLLLSLRLDPAVRPRVDARCLSMLPLRHEHSFASHKPLEPFGAFGTSQNLG